MNDNLNTNMKTNMKTNMDDNLNTRTLFSNIITSDKIILPFNNVGENLKITLEEYLKRNFEGKCNNNGFIKPDSCKLRNYSCGTIFDGNFVSFDIIYDCLACYPVEGMLMECVVRNITKVGLKCDSVENIPSPVLIHVAKEHNLTNRHFQDIKEGDKIKIRVISVRFELNDLYVSIAAELYIDYKVKNKLKDNN